MGGHSFVGPQLGQDPPGELLPKLHAPLVEAEYVPDRPLGKNLVLVQANEAAGGL
jgi:hypothetical protein